MKAKITVILCLLLLSCLLLTACSNNDKGPTADTTETILNNDEEKAADPVKTSINKDGELIDFLNHSDKYSTSIKELTPYSYIDFLLSIPYRMPTTIRSKSNIYAHASSILCNLWDFNNAFPIQLIKVIDEDRILVTYLLDRDGTDFYANLTFEKSTVYYEKSGSIEEAGYYEKWTCFGEYYFITRANSYEQYKDLQVGDVLSEDELNKLAVFTDNIPNSKADFLPYQKEDFKIEDIKAEDLIREEICPLREGVLKLQFKINDNYMPCEVTSVEFFPYGEETEESKGISIIGDSSLIELPD